MTTVGVEVKNEEKIYPQKIPSYTYKYPTFRQVQIAAVKHDLFHPCLPTLRRMDMDTINHKLSDEHSRTVTTCGPEDFKRSTTTLFEPPRHKLACLDLTQTGRNLHREYSIPEALKRSRIKWNEFLNRCPERFDISLPEIPDPKDFHFKGYAIRYVRPDITASWRKTLKSEPMLDQYGQRPVPVNIFSRYRDTYPQYSRNISQDAWRP